MEIGLESGIDPTVWELLVFFHGNLIRTLFKILQEVAVSNWKLDCLLAEQPQGSYMQT